MGPNLEGLTGQASQGLAGLTGLSSQSLSPGSLFGGLLFGLIGTAAFMYAKKEGDVRAGVIGVLLGIYPWFVSSLWLLYGIGILLVAGLFVGRD